MLAHQTQRNLSNAREYLREHLQGGDYYSAGQRITGEWFGSGAEVRVEGRNLRELLLEIQAAKVELLREIPEYFEPLTNEVIRAIRVKDVGMQQEMPTHDRAFSV